MPYTRFSAWSRMAQVLTTMSALGPSVKAAAHRLQHAPECGWLSATFCWQPKVSTIASGVLPRLR